MSATPAKAIEPIFEAVLNEQGPETRTAVENIAGAKATENPSLVAHATAGSHSASQASHKAPDSPHAG